MNNKSRNQLKTQSFKKLQMLEASRIDALYSRVQTHIDYARQHVQRTIDTGMVNAYWCVGREIIEEEQQGKERPGYGQAVLKTLSHRLTKKYGRGFSVDNLERA